MSYDIPRKRKVNRAAQSNFIGSNDALRPDDLDALVRAGFKASNPDFDPVADIPNKAFWYDAADASSVSLSGNNVTQWDDKSGNGGHLTQGVAVDQPLYNQSTINGKNVITTTATQFMTTPGNANTNPVLYDIFIVNKPTFFDVINGILAAMNTFNDGGFSITTTSATAYLGFISDGVGLIEQPISTDRRPTLNVVQIFELISQATPTVRNEFIVGGIAGSIAGAGNHGTAYPAARNLAFNKFLETQIGFGHVGDTGEILCIPRIADEVERSNILFNYLVPKWMGI